MEGYFQYGVESPWDGRNALPAMMEPDCMVEVQFKLGRHKEMGNAGRFNWMMVESYKVVDDRYKPTSLKSWFEAGEFPPAGAECEYTIGDNFGGYKQCCFVGFNSRGSFVIELLDGELKSFHKHQIKFRPLKTDRDKFIDAAADIISAMADEGSEPARIAAALFDAGFKAPE